jgi:hypothetical protein
MEKLQLRPTFPGKPLIKTCVALRESCRSIAPLQLLFLKIFKLVVTFSSFAFVKMLKWNKRGAANAVAAPRASCARCGRAGHVASAHPFGVRKPRHLRGGPRTVVGSPPRLFPPYTAPRLRPHRTGATRPCADAHTPAGAHAGPAGHATSSALGCPPTSSASFRRRSAKNREFTSSPSTLCTATVLHGRYRHLASPHSIPVAQPLLSLP